MEHGDEGGPKLPAQPAEDTGSRKPSGVLGGGSPDSQTGALPQPTRAPGLAALPFHAGQDWLLRKRQQQSDNLPKYL